MGGTIMARIRGGMLEPLEVLDLPEGTLVNIAIAPVSFPDSETSRSAAGSWRGLVDADALIRDLYAARKISRPEPRL